MKKAQVEVAYFHVTFIYINITISQEVTAHSLQQYPEYIFQGISIDSFLYLNVYL